MGAFKEINCPFLPEFGMMKVRRKERLPHLSRKKQRISLKEDPTHE